MSSMSFYPNAALDGPGRGTHLVVRFRLVYFCDLPSSLPKTGQASRDPILDSKGTTGSSARRLTVSGKGGGGGGGGDGGEGLPDKHVFKPLPEQTC
ncbi:hypothetical protein GGTG_05903 [Gaeumannomyces tritici R3-111a-1]|uniref:Uncharacterized protein n=1 Tax=Gaeumannomyces tritici (strain R3-111a-1) TaxID=644352 RepID=J3NX96_GAET3|nr:hypothetical protein GGTG_05903 [Gaeumannomyces tritici R3-111a-1]EJT75978.1 hypothetical protein GGTG_05903 [Gaeumannomyces tritici R3-111a-1]